MSVAIMNNDNMNNINNINNKLKQQMLINTSNSNTNDKLKQPSVSNNIFTFLREKKVELKSNIINIYNWLTLLDYMFYISKIKNTSDFQAKLQKTMNSAYDKAIKFNEFCEKTKSQNLQKVEFEDKIKKELQKQLIDIVKPDKKGGGSKQSRGAKQYGGAENNQSQPPLFNMIFAGIFIITLTLRSFGCDNRMYNVEKKMSDYDLCDHIIGMELWSFIVLLFRCGYLILTKSMIARPRQVRNHDPYGHLEWATEISSTMPALTNAETQNAIVNNIGTVDTFANIYSGPILRSMRKIIATQVPVAVPLTTTNSEYRPDRPLDLFPIDYDYNRIPGSKQEYQQAYEAWQNEQQLLEQEYEQQEYEQQEYEQQEYEQQLVEQNEPTHQQRLDEQSRFLDELYQLTPAQREERRRQLEGNNRGGTKRHKKNKKTIKKGKTIKKIKTRKS